MSPDFEPVQQSYLSWMLASLGPYALLLPLAGMLCFLLALVLVVRGKGPMAAASLILIVHVPLLIGVFGAIHGGIASYQVIAVSAATPKPSDVAAGIRTYSVPQTLASVSLTPYVLAAMVRGQGPAAR